MGLLAIGVSVGVCLLVDIVCSEYWVPRAKNHDRGAVWRGGWHVVFAEGSFLAPLRRFVLVGSASGQVTGENSPTGLIGSAALGVRNLVRRPHVVGMTSRPSVIERALQLAKSGLFDSVSDIRTQLVREDYLTADAVRGTVLVAKLRTLIATAQHLSLP